MMLSPQQFRDRTGLDADSVAATLEAAAASAASVTLAHFRQPLAVENKHAEGFDPVTIADRQAEKAIRAVIAERFPQHGLIGEEQASERTTSEFAWIMDPIDGTRSFITGVPLWGTLIGLSHQGEMLAGIMHQPFIAESFLAVPGRAVYQRAGQSIPLATSGCKDLSKARLFATSPDLFDTPQRQAAWQKVEQRARLTRFGTDCYAYALLAAGHTDVVVEARLNTYDIAPLIPLIEGAGGVVATWDGGSAMQGGDVVAAASPQLLEQTLEAIALGRAA